MTLIYLGETRGKIKRCIHKDGRFGLFGEKCNTYNTVKSKRCTKCGKRI